MGTFWGLIFQRVPFSFKQKRIDRVRNYGYGNIQADFDGDVVDKGDENLRLLDFIRSSENMQRNGVLSIFNMLTQFKYYG